MSPGVVPGLRCRDPAEEKHSIPAAEQNQRDGGGFWDTALDGQENHDTTGVEYNLQDGGGFWDATLDSQARLQESQETAIVSTAASQPETTPEDVESSDRLPGRWRKTKEQALPFAKPPPPGCDFFRPLPCPQDATRCEPPAVAPPAPPAIGSSWSGQEISYPSIPAMATLGRAPTAAPPEPPCDKAAVDPCIAVENVREPRSLLRLGPAPSGAPPAPPCDIGQGDWINDLDSAENEETKFEEFLQPDELNDNSNEKYVATFDGGLDELEVAPPPVQRNGVVMPMARQVLDD